MAFRNWVAASRRLAWARLVTFCVFAAALVLLQGPAHRIAAEALGGARGALAAALGCGALLGLPLGVLFQPGAVTLAVLAALPAAAAVLVAGGSAPYAASLVGFMAVFAWMGSRVRPRRLHHRRSARPGT